jgi:hypothetical protein
MRLRRIHPVTGNQGAGFQIAVGVVKVRNTMFKKFLDIQRAGLVHYDSSLGEGEEIESATWIKRSRVNCLPIRYNIHEGKWPASGGAQTESEFWMRVLF